MNLSNSPQADSQQVEITPFGDKDTKIIDTWWERNESSNEPVCRLA